MVHVINWQGRARFADAVEQMHRLRKQVFIDFFKWSLTHQNGLEIDQFDTPDAYYLFDQDPDTGAVISSLRLLPTTGPHMMDSLFSHLCAADWPRGPNVFEVSRLLYNPVLQTADEAVVLRARRRLALGILEFCTLWGINELVFVTHAKFLARLLSYDWDIRPLGLPTLEDGQQVAAMRLRLTANTLHNLRTQFRHFEPVLQTCPPRPQKAA
ncbi:acyl-homoserine-lactone synthase [Pedomonas sp. V897]|uniref:acyl-homoserine-lactone synthase n=1 Tax=Pedomonas sp. V897 TaxID=3446482 RepID=UPI003EE3045B